MTLALPAAMCLLAESTTSEDRKSVVRGLETLAEATRHADAHGEDAVRFGDGIGHTRPHYRHLFLQLHLQAWGKVGGEDTLPVPVASLTPPRPAATEAGVQTMWAYSHAWLAVYSEDEAAAEKMRADARAAVDGVLSTPGRDGSMQPCGLDDLVDAWTYQEMVAIHALDGLAALLDETAWAQRVTDACLFHQGHTQPDYTTYQPWGLAAFAARESTVMFAEQQLHDAQSHLSIEGRPGALLPALLLANAAGTLHARAAGR